MIDEHIVLDKNFIFILFCLLILIQNILKMNLFTLK